MAESLRFVLMGDPVAHSLSPVMQRDALEQAGLRGSYEAVQGDESDLESAVRSLRQGGLDGINVTMPLKVRAAQLCDHLTPEASAAGSVNTLRARGGSIEGHSTDVVALGAVRDSRFPGLDAVLILGSGGAAAAALAAFQDVVVYLSARDPSSASWLGSRSELAGLLPWGAGVAGSVVVNATPVGMAGEQLPEAVLGTASGLIDLPYGTAPTPAVARARGEGLVCVDGVELLAEAAAASFHWWTGSAVDSDSLVRAARNA